jgi:hypothetical protein
MKRFPALPLLAAMTLCVPGLDAQVPTVPNDTHAAVRAAINTGLNYLDAKQLTGAGAPSAQCDASHNLGVPYIRTDAGAVFSSLYICGNTGSGTYAWEGPYFQNAIVSTGTYSNPSWLTGLAWSKITGLSGCSSGNPLVGYDGACRAASGSTTFQANGVGLSSSSIINFLNSNAFNGLTFTFTNPSAGGVQLGASGTLNNAGLTNSAITFSLPGIFSGGGSVSLGGTFSLGLNTQSANAIWAGPATGAAASPTFRALVGADLPLPSASTLGGIQSLVSASHRWINTISTSGVPGTSQPACGDLSDAAASCNSDTTNAANILTGTLNHARLPALVSGDIPNNGANTSGNAATATALAANGANCSPGNYPLGVDASGNAENCTAVPSGGGSITTSGLTAYSCYYRASGSYALAEANALSTTPCLGVASSTTNLVTNGAVTNVSWTWTDGGPIYLSASSAGGLTQTVPSSGNFVQLVGIAIAATSMYVNPSFNVAGN